MGAMVFAILMFLLLIFGVGCSIFGLILFFMQRNEKRNMNQIPALKIVSIIVIIVGVISFIFPIGWTLFISSAF